MSKRFLSLPDVMCKVGYSRPSIYRKIALGEFPRQYNLGARAVGFLETGIDAWIQARIDQSEEAVRKSPRRRCANDSQCVWRSGEGAAPVMCEGG